MSTDAYAQLRVIARRRGQRGHFTAAQAQDAGLTPSQLSRLVERGLVTRVAPRVYRFTVTAAPAWKDELAAKLLSTGGLASGLTATALYNLNAPPGRPAVMVARGGHGPRRHSTRELTRYETAVVDGLPTLAPVRALLDAAHRVPRAEAITMIETAIVRGLVKPTRLEQRARELQHNKRPGCAVTLEILRQLHPELARSRNQWEALVVRRAIQFGLPQPELECEVIIEGRRYVLDAAWPAVLVALEFDGRDPHMRRRVHDSDTLRRNDLQSAGWRRFGITAAALQRGDDRVLRQVARVLALPGI